MSRHELDVTSLVAGTVLLGLAVVHLVAEAQDATVDVAWLAASALVALGVVAVTVGVARSVRARPAADGPPDEPSDDAVAAPDGTTAPTDDPAQE